MTPRGALDRPQTGTVVYRHGFDVDGWAAAGPNGPWHEIIVRHEDAVIGRTAIRYQRRDVATEYGADFLNVGFTVRCVLPQALHALPALELHCEAVDASGERSPVAIFGVCPSEADYRNFDFGGVLLDDYEEVLDRSIVYTSGPPSGRADANCAHLAMRYLREGDRILDVGCGIGAWAHELRPRGIDWTGCEARLEFVERMKAEGLPAVHVTGALPFADAAFDATICIEVLEHVTDKDAFLAETARVSRRGGIFSVPNFGVVPITASRNALPWHMLEGDHKWFFTTRSLGALLRRFYAHVEVFEYGPLPYLQSADLLPIYNHLFAVALH